MVAAAARITGTRNRVQTDYEKTANSGSFNEGLGFRASDGFSFYMLEVKAWQNMNVAFRAILMAC